MDRLAAMQAFVRVVEAGTFTKAADRLDLPKNTVTRLIQMLEAHLQTQLLHRSTRRVAVTADGAAYYDRAVRVLGDIEELELSLSRATGTPRGRLRVAVAAAMANHLLIPTLPDFHQRYPDIQIELCLNDNLVDLAADNIDCALHGGEIADQSLVARRIGESQTVAAASPSYLKRFGTPKHPSDFDGSHHRVINYTQHRSGKPLLFSFTKGQEKVQLVGTSLIAVNDFNAVLVAGISGVGVVIATTFMASKLFESGALVPLFVDWSGESFPIYVVYPPNKHLNSKVRVFVDWVADLFETSQLIRRQCGMQAP